MTDIKRTIGDLRGGEHDSQTARADAPPLSKDAQELIARRLREAYGSNLNEPVPDKFTKLLEQLAKKS